MIWQFFLRSEPERKIVSEIKPPLLLHTQSQQLVSFQNFLLMTQGWWIQWTTYYMMTPWMRCLEYQALCLLHFIWEQLQQKTSQQSIQHSRWQLFVSISPRFFVISEGAFLFCSILYDSPKWLPLASNCLALLVWELFGMTISSIYLRAIAVEN